MKTPILDTENNATFTDLDRANKMVHAMNNDAEDNWHYEVVDAGNGKAYIVSMTKTGSM